MAFNFGIDISVAKKNQDRISSSISIASKHTSGNAHVLLLLEATPKQSSKFKLAIEILLHQMLPGFDYDVIVASKLSYTAEQIQKHGVYKYYQEYSTDFMVYIKPNTIIMTSGYALQSITLADDLSVKCFYDYIFNKTYFYSPRTGTYVFPFDALNVVFKLTNDYYAPMDCSRTQFMYLQFQTIKNKYDMLSKPPVRKRIKIEQVISRSDWYEFLNVGSKFPKISYDLETDGFNYHRNRIGCVSASFDGITGYYIPWELFSVEEFDDLIKNKYQIGANKKFDDKFLKYQGLKNGYTHSDVLQLGHILNEMRFNGLKSLAYYYTQNGGYDFELDQYIQNFRPKNYLEIPILPSYAAQDAIHAFNAEAVMQKQLTQLDIDFPPHDANGWTVRKLYEDLIIPYQNMFIDVEMRGISVDTSIWKENAILLQSDILGLKEELRKSLMISSVDNFDSSFSGIFELNEDNEGNDELQSGKQLGEILQKLKWEDLGRTKGGWYKTGDDQLLRWSQLGHIEASTIQKMRSYLTLQKTFMGTPDGDKGWWPHVITDHDGSTSIYPTYGTTLTDTIRNNCHDPNYQQIPSTSKNLGKKIESFKRIFTVPDKDKYYLVTCDLASAQIRLAAIDSEDETLTKAYSENPDVDIHSKTGYNIFCKDSTFPIEEIVLEDGGKTKIYFPHETIKILRSGSEIEVKAVDVLPSDSLI